MKGSNYYHSQTAGHISVGPPINIIYVSFLKLNRTAADVCEDRYGSMFGLQHISKWLTDNMVRNDKN